jgi:hypothetical protein
MNLVLLIFLSFVVLIARSYGQDLNYGQYKTIEEVIEAETAEILNIQPTNPEFLSHAYISRGESYLISENY